MGRKLPYWFVVMTAVVLLAASALLWKRFSATSNGPLFPAELSGIVLPGPRPLQPFTLSDQEDRPFTLAHFQGHWTFLFFGYTHCPDICPMAMGILGEVFNRLQKSSPPDLVGTEVAFVTVDPKHDTPTVLKSYVAYFNPGFKGLTGTEEQINALTRQVGAAYFATSPPQDSVEKGPSSPSSRSEVSGISHTSAFFLIDPLGRLVALFPEYNNTDLIVKEYTKIRQFVRLRNIYAEPEYNR